MPPAIWWIRRDLRLADNQALAAALDAGGGEVIPLFVLDPFFEGSPYAGEPRRAFMLGGLRALDEALRARGGRLIVRRGDPVEVLPRVAAESGAAAIYAEEDYSPYARERDVKISAGLPLHLTPGLTIHPPDAVTKDDGEPYVVFTPFSRRWRGLNPPARADILPVPERITTPAGLESDGIPDAPRLPESIPFIPGEEEAQRRLAAFVSGDDAPVYHYQARRDLPAVEGTSRLSPYLRWGMISPRRVVHAAIHAQASAPTPEQQDAAITWLTELIWREFYIGILYHFPRVRGASFRTEYDGIQWRDDPQGLAAWREGRTGYPLVDAAMRELAATGWMHNRARMIVASFLVKDLLIDWREGERWFMQRLVDGDPAANNGGWQWAAGTGTDAAPYFRIFNPTAQSKKFDPDGAYIRRWVPELADVPGKYIHEPARMPQDVQHGAGCRIGVDYPAPIVDHRMARERCLAAYKAGRERGRAT